MASCSMILDQHPVPTMAIMKECLTSFLIDLQDPQAISPKKVQINSYACVVTACSRVMAMSPLDSIRQESGVPNPDFAACCQPDEILKRRGTQFVAFLVEPYTFSRGMRQRLKFEERRPPVLDHVEQEALPNTKHGGKRFFCGRRSAVEDVF